MARSSLRRGMSIIESDKIFSAALFDTAHFRKTASPASLIRAAET
jgi:hypothetical protein